MGIGEKLETLLKEKNRNANDISTATGIPASTIYSIIRRNNSKVDLAVLQVIARELGVTLEYFTDSKEETYGHYMDSETAQYAQEMFERPEMRTLFSTARNVKKEDLALINEMLKKMSLTVEEEDISQDYDEGSGWKSDIEPE